jgi:probable LLM family oxidoreductase
MQLGVFTFADMPTTNGKPMSELAHQRITDLMEEIELADQVGLDVFGLGEHHRPEYAISSPATIMAAAAVRTKNIKLTSAVTVLSSDDPVRVFQSFATVDLLSHGRVEIMAGRGSFIESFPLFGYNLGDYDSLFAEKLGLLLQLNEGEHVTWSGKHRSAIQGLGVYPRPLQKKIPIWIAIGGTPESVVRAATLGLPMALAIIGGTPDRFAPLVQFYRDNGKKAGTTDKLKVGINSMTYIAETSQQAADEFYPAYVPMMNKIGRERGWAPMGRPHYDEMIAPHGALLVGSPQQVIDKILYEHDLFKHDRFMAQIGVGSLDHAKVMKAIELFGSKVAPAVRKALGST